MKETALKLELSQSGAASLLKKNPFDSSPTILQQKSIYLPQQTAMTKFAVRT